LFEAVYRPIDAAPTRKLTKRMSLTAWPESAATNFIYDIDKDEPYQP
jgi:hypothetical protein